MRLGFISSPCGGPPQWVNCGTSGEGIRCDGIALPRNFPPTKQAPLSRPRARDAGVCSAAEAEKVFCAAGGRAHRSVPEGETDGR